MEIASRTDCLRQIKTFGNTDDDYETCSSDSDEFDEEDDDYCYEVKSFYIYQSPQTKFIPKGITIYFRNLTVLVIAKSGLKSVTKSDLKPFPNIKGLYLDKNELEVLEEDLFENNPKLEELNFSENLLKHIAHDILEPLKKLTRADFFTNPCIDFGASNKREIEILKRVFQDKFEPKPKKFQTESEEILESCKMFCEQ